MKKSQSSNYVNPTIAARPALATTDAGLGAYTSTAYPTYESLYGLYNNTYNNNANALQQILESQKASLASSYGTTINTLDTNRTNAQQYADVTLHRLQKYLPQLRASQGLPASATTELQAYNTAMKLRAQADSDYMKYYTSAKNEYDTNLTKYQSDYNTGLLGLQNTRDSAIAELQEQEISDKQAADDTFTADTVLPQIADILTKAQSSGWVSQADKSKALGLLRTAKNSIGAQEYNYYMDIINKTETVDTNKGWNEGETVPIGGGKYKIQSAVSDTDLSGDSLLIRKLRTQVIENGYAGLSDKTIPFGTVITVYPFTPSDSTLPLAINGTTYAYLGDKWYIVNKDDE